MGHALPLLALLVLATAAAEAIVLWQIAHHPATGSNQADDALRQLLTGAALPLLGCLVAGIVLWQSGRRIPLVRYGVALGMGAVLMVVALAQYSHATPGFYLMGIVIQVVLLVWATLGASKDAI